VAPFFLLAMVRRHHGAASAAVLLLRCPVRIHHLTHFSISAT